MSQPMRSAGAWPHFLVNAKCSPWLVRPLQERIRVQLDTAADVQRQLASAMDADVADSRLALHERRVAALGEARAAAAAALRIAQAGEPPEAQAELAALEAALGGAALEASIERLQAAIADGEARFQASLARAAAPAAGGAGGEAPRVPKGASPDELVALHDSLAHGVEALSETAGALGGRQAEGLMEACSVRVTVVAAGRCYWAAHAHLAAGKALEAFALFQRAAAAAQAAAERMKELPAPPAAWLAELAAVAQKAALYQSVRRCDARLCGVFVCFTVVAVDSLLALPLCHHACTNADSLLRSRRR